MQVHTYANSGTCVDAHVPAYARVHTHIHTSTHIHSCTCEPRSHVRHGVDACRRHVSGLGVVHQAHDARRRLHGSRGASCHAHASRTCMHPYIHAAYVRLFILSHSLFVRTCTHTHTHTHTHTLKHIASTWLWASHAVLVHSCCIQV